MKIITELVGEVTALVPETVSAWNAIGNKINEQNALLAKMSGVTNKFATVNMAMMQQQQFYEASKLAYDNAR